MNNKGQTLVIFVLLLPLFLLLFAYVVDTSIMFYEKNKLDDINKMVIDYKMYHVEENEKKIKEYIIRNDEEIEIESIKMDEEKIELHLSKKVKSIFGRIIGVDYYDVDSSYRGLILKKEIEKIKE